MSRGRHGTVRMLVEPEKAKGMKLCSNCKHCDGRTCTRNQIKTPDKVMIDVVDGTTHTFTGETKGWLSCAREREPI